MIKIITDSASDIEQEYAKQVGIEVLPLSICFDKDVYLDGVDISKKEFYEKLIETAELPKTSQVTPYQYSLAFSKYSEDDDILYISLSKKLSGSYKASMVAAKDFKNVHVVDSLNVAMGQRILVEYAIRLVNEGKNIEEVVKELEAVKDKIKVIAVLDTLEYLKKGGRISATAAFFGGMLKIKPVIAVKDGLIEVLGKARGSKNGNNMLRQLVLKSGGVDSSKPNCLGYSGLTTEILENYVKNNSDLYEGDINDLLVSQIGSTIGCHVGPGAIGVAFFSKE